MLNTLKLNEQQLSHILDPMLQNPSKSSWYNSMKSELLQHMKQLDKCCSISPTSVEEIILTNKLCYCEQFNKKILGYPWY